MTCGYVVVLALTHVWLTVMVSPAAASRLTLAASTNLHNLARDPAGTLIGSALFFDGSLSAVTTEVFAGTFVTLIIGVGVALAWLEARFGASRAYAVFLAGHIGATLSTSQVIRLAIARGWYSTGTRYVHDYGISYGAEAVLAAVTFSLPWLVRLPWAGFVIAWPIFGAVTLRPIPDFTTIGHLTAAVIGFCLAGAGLVARPAAGDLAPPLETIGAPDNAGGAATDTGKIVEAPAGQVEAPADMVAESRDIPPAAASGSDPA